jgi:hypothetical protein
MIISKLFIIHEADPKTYTRLVCRIFGGHTSSSLLWSADGDDFVVVIPLSDDWSAQLQAEFQQAQPMGSRLEIAGLRYDLQPSGGICRINRNGCKATVRNEDLVKGTPIILRDGDKTFEVPREHSSLMHAVITGCAFSQTAPDFSGRIQLSNYSSLDTSQFCALLDYFRGKDITEIGGGCGHFAWTMLALGAKSVTSYDENPPEAFPPGHPRITQQLKELGWEFIQKDLGHGLTPEVTEHLVVAWPTPPDDTTYTVPSRGRRYCLSPAKSFIWEEMARTVAARQSSERCWPRARYWRLTPAGKARSCIMALVSGRPAIISSGRR